VEVRRRRLFALLLSAIAVFVVAGVATRRADVTAPNVSASGAPTTTVAPRGYPGMPPVVDPTNIYSEIGPDHVPAAIGGQPARVYVPNGKSNTVSVIDPATRTVVATIPTDAEPQHIVPSYDLSTLWVLDNQGNTVIPIDPATGTTGTKRAVDDPYNMYFTPDGASAIIVAEANVRLDFRDPHTMALTGSLAVPGCNGINHADYNADGAYLIVTCEFAGKVAKVDVLHRTVVGLLDLSTLSLPGQPHPGPMVMPDGGSAEYMPQDVRVAPDGRHFYVADMMAGGLFVIDGDTLTAQQFIPTGIGTHGITPSRDGSTFFIANRGTMMIDGPPHGAGSVSVVDTATNTVTDTWMVPNGGSPDMGNLNAAGTELWLSGRFDSEVYVFDTVHGGMAARIAVGHGPHGLAVWPQAGRYSLGHTGNMR
jgi:YVTN family beta-propeller protein